MEIKIKLAALGLNTDNAIVIGSGILNALYLRKSRDIDVVVAKEAYRELLATDRLKKRYRHGREVLTDGVFEIATSWIIVGKAWRFATLQPHTTVVDGVRYNSVEFLLDAKRRWLANGDVRQKDIDDVKLMEAYLGRQKY